MHPEEKCKAALSYCETQLSKSQHMLDDAYSRLEVLDRIGKPVTMSNKLWNAGRQRCKNLISKCIKRTSHYTVLRDALTEYMKGEKND